MQIKYPFELSSLKSSNVPLDKVKKGDVVRIKDSELDALRDFYNESYDGNPIKLFSKNFAIAIFNDTQVSSEKDEPVFFFVRALEDGKLLQVDAYVDNDEYQKEFRDAVVCTVILDNKTPKIKVEGNRFYTEAYNIERNTSLMKYASYADKNNMTIYISDVVSYVLFFMQENLDNPEYVTKTANSHTENSGKKKKNKGQKKSKRGTIYVPKKIVKTEKEKNDEDSDTDNVGTVPENEEKTKRTYTGHIEEWKSRGHKRRLVSKDGEVRYVDVKPSVHKRNPKLMAKGQDNGKDIKLRLKK